MAYQNITADAYTANITAAVVNAYIDEMPTLFLNSNKLMRLLIGGGKDQMPDTQDSKGYGEVLKPQAGGGDYLRLVHAKSPFTTVGRADTSDPFTQATEQVLGKALWAFRDHSGRILIDAGEIWRADGNEAMAKDYVKNMVKIALSSFNNALARYFHGYGYVKSAYLGSSTTAGRQGMQGFAFMADGPTDNKNGITDGTGNGNKDGGTLTGSSVRTTMTATVDRYYGGIDRDDSTATRWQGNHWVCNGTLSYSQISGLILECTHDSGPKFLNMPKRIFTALKVLGEENQRFGRGEGFSLGTNSLSVDNVPCYYDESMNPDTTTTGPYKKTSATGGIFFDDADTTQAATALDLVEMVENAIEVVNPDKIYIRALPMSCNGDGTPKLQAAQQSQQVIGEIATMTWSAAMGGEPYYQGVLSKIP